MGLAPTATVQIRGHKNCRVLYSKLNKQQQKKSTVLISTENNMSDIVLQNSPPAAAAPHIPYSHPKNQSQAITYKLQSAHSQVEFLTFIQQKDIV